MRLNPHEIRLGRLAARAHLLLPGALTAFFGFQAGGFFPGSVAFGAILVLIALLLRFTCADEPWAGWSRTAAVAAAGAAALAGWVLLSALWSGAPGRALPEFDRALLYVSAFTVTATSPREPGDLTVALRWMLLAIVAIAAAGLATRLYPAQLGHIPPRDAARLGWPLTYWNAMGVVCALGAVLALHAATGREEPAAVRVLATAALPVLVVAGYFTFSRGAIGTAAIGLVLYVVVAHPRRLPFTLVTGGIAATVALGVAYGAEALATPGYFRGSGPAQGRDVATAVVLAAVLSGVARLALLGLERRVDRIEVAPARRRGLLAGVALGAFVLVAVSAAALDAPGRLRAEAHAFVDRGVVVETRDYRQRLDDPANNGRLAFWRVDLDAFRTQPLHGVGAAMYRAEWEQRRPYDLQAVDGHSLYLETLAELGVVGLALLAVFLAAILVGAARGLRSRESHARAALLAALLALLLHAAIDWDWEMPALFAGLLGAAGIACAAPRGGPARARPTRLLRVVAGLGVLLLAVTPAAVWASEGDLDDAQAAFARGDCPAAIDAALGSLGKVSVRPEPSEIIGYCDLRSGANALGVRAMRTAQANDPRNWRYAYGLALAQARAGGDPRPAARTALRLDPREPLARSLVQRLRASPPARWPIVAARSRLPAD